MASLERIARALGSSQVELLAGTGDVPAAAGARKPESGSVATPLPVVVRHDDNSWGRFGDGTARLLVAGDRRLNPMEFIGSNPAFGDFFVHAEDEFLTVVTGGLVVQLGGDHGGESDGGPVHELGVGDSLYCEGGTPHRWRAATPDPYRLFLVKENPHRP